MTYNISSPFPAPTIDLRAVLPADSIDPRTPDGRLLDELRTELGGDPMSDMTVPPAISNVWVETKHDATVPANHIRAITIDYSPPLWRDGRLLTHTPPRRWGRRSRQPDYRAAWTIGLETAGRSFQAASCETSSQAEDTKHALVTALIQHRDASGVLVHDGLRGWHLTAVAR